MGRQKNLWKDREIDKLHIQIGKQTAEETEIDKWTDKQREALTDLQMNEKTDSWTDEPTDV
jgi:hypothetical protein